MDDAANEAIVANEAADSDDEANGVLDNQLAELEKLDAANKAIVSNKADDAVESNAANNADSADEAADAAETTKANEAEANKAANEADAKADEADEANENIEKVRTADKLPIDSEHVIDSVIVYFFRLDGDHSPSQYIVQSSRKIRDIFFQSQTTIN